METLKKRVIETLGEASNFRHIAPNEFIMVTVTGAPSATAALNAFAAYKADSDPMSAQPAGRTISTFGMSGYGSAPGRVFKRHGAFLNGSNRATLMTIRIKQSDALALADHKNEPRRLHESRASDDIPWPFHPANALHDRRLAGTIRLLFPTQHSA